MPTPIEYADASPQVRAVYDDIKKSRNVPDVNNFWKYLAHDPATLKRTWESIKEIMAPGALDPLTKEMVYLAVSVTNGCAYCIASHTAAPTRKFENGAIERSRASLAVSSSSCKLSSLKPDLQPRLRRLPTSHEFFH